MPALPTGWRGRGLAVALLLVVLAAVYLVVAAPLLDLYAERAALAASRRALLLKLSDIGGELPALTARVAKLRAAEDSHKLVLEGASDAIASAALQGHMGRFAAGVGVAIGSTETLPAQARGDYRRIGLRLLISGSYASLMKLLAAIETSTPALVIDNLQIRGFVGQLGASSASRLDASLDVYGFRAKTGGIKTQ